MKTKSKLIRSIGIAASMLAIAALAQTAKEYSVKSLPPSVVKTVPLCGATDVDPTLKEITAAFSKDMLTNRMWAICQISEETFPKSAGQIHYKADKRTVVMPVKLEPGKTYVLWFNRGQYNSFRDADNHPAVPYQLVFETRK